MEEILAQVSVILEPYKDVIARTAQLLSFGQMLSPIIVLNNIRKAKSTLGISVIPFLFAVVITSLGARFGQIFEEKTTLQSNLLGLVIFSIYVSIFFYLSDWREKIEMIRKFIFVGIFIAGFMVYSKIEDPSKIKTRFGIIITTLFYIFFTHPIYNIVKAVREKSVRHLPFPMLIVGFSAASFWTTYSIIIQNIFMLLQHSVMMILGFSQLSLFLCFSSENKEIQKDEELKVKKDD